MLFFNGTAGYSRVKLDCQIFIKTQERHLFLVPSVLVVILSVLLVELMGLYAGAVAFKKEYGTVLMLGAVSPLFMFFASKSYIANAIYKIVELLAKDTKVTNLWEHSKKRKIKSLIGERSSVFLLMKNQVFAFALFAYIAAFLFGYFTASSGMDFQVLFDEFIANINDVGKIVLLVLSAAYMVVFLSSWHLWNTLDSEIMIRVLRAYALEPIDIDEV